jgi:murein DD-endopeptidase MepM/ murein hydrolase activator NlpD
VPIDATTPIAVEFPLRGEWTAAHTPAARVPSHGTDALAQRYAYDFLRIEHAHSGWKFWAPSTLRYYVAGVRLADCHGWDAPIHAPFDGRVVCARDGLRERDPVHFLRDLSIVLRNALTFRPENEHCLHAVLGNHLVLEMAHQPVYALIAHARTGSIRVRAGEPIVAGRHLANVGHSGNSTAPHLHFQLMDGPDPVTASGLPCCFRRYQTREGERWSDVVDGTPGRRERIRGVGCVLDPASGSGAYPTPLTPPEA